MHDVLREFAVWVAGFLGTSLVYLLMVRFAVNRYRARRARRNQHTIDFGGPAHDEQSLGVDASPPLTRMRPDAQRSEKQTADAALQTTGRTGQATARLFSSES